MGKHSMKSLSQDFKKKPVKDKKFILVKKLDKDGIHVEMSGERNDIYHMMVALVHSVANNEGSSPTDVVSMILGNLKNVGINGDNKNG